MPGPHLQFLIFSLFSLGCLFAGYAGRRRGWIPESWSRPLHTQTVIWIWSLISLVSLWNMPMDRGNLWLLAVMPLLVVLPAFAAIPLARAIGAGRSEVGVLACAAGLGNTGSTLGAYLAYLLFAPAGEAMSYGIAIVSIMSVAGILTCYPLARHFAAPAGEAGPVAGLIARSLFDVRAMPLYASLLGLGLSAAGAPYPAFVLDWRLVDVLCYLAAFGGYLGIGLRLRLGDSGRYLPHHTLLALLRFLLLPGLAAALLWLLAGMPAPLPPLGRRVLMLEACMPTAIMSVIIANMFHLDTRLASVLWLWNTLLFFLVPLPIILWMTAG